MEIAALEGANNKKVDEVIPGEYTGGGQDFGRTLTLRIAMDRGEILRGS